MVKKHTHARANEAGFTLVELAIVMIIIGLLIGGILKGQELIGNAKIKSTVAQIKGFDAAVNTFRDQFNTLPGDMLTPSTRLPASACTTTACTTAGDGNGKIDVPAIGTVPGPTEEGFTAFAQLAAAGLVTGVDGTAVVGFGTSLPQASIGGGYWLGYSTDGTLGGSEAGSGRIGHYIVFNGDTVDVGTDTGAVTTAQAARIDRTLDDGQPSAGSVITDGNCMTGTVYDEADDTKACALFIRVLN